MNRQRRNKNKSRGRSSSAGPSGRVLRRGKDGRSYGGTITALDLHKPQSFTRRPEKGLKDANYSTCQAVGSFAISTNILGGGGIPPYIEANAGADNPFALAFSLQDVGQVATLTALFDQYRFDKVEIRLVPASSSVETFNVASPNNSVPSIYAVLDFDDSTALASLAAAQQYDNVQITRYGEGLSITVLPSNTPALYASGGFSGYEVQRADWVDCANTAVGHYGVKGIITELTALSTSTAVWYIYAKYYLSFRNTR